MPYKYVLKWYRGEKERITVEAWHRYPNTKQEKEKPAFEIGSVNGSIVVILRDSVQKIIETYGSRKYGPTLRVEFPFDDTKAIAEAYRLGLAASVLKYAPDNDSLHRASVYVLNITNEEVWFWTSKLLDQNIGTQRTISALCVISGTWDIPKQGRKITMKSIPSNQMNLNKFGWSSK